MVSASHLFWRVMIHHDDHWKGFGWYYYNWVSAGCDWKVVLQTSKITKFTNRTVSLSVSPKAQSRNNWTIRATIQYTNCNLHGLNKVNGNSISWCYVYIYMIYYIYTLTCIAWYILPFSLKEWQNWILMTLHFLSKKGNPQLLHLCQHIKLSICRGTTRTVPGPSCGVCCTGCRRSKHLSVCKMRKVNLGSLTTILYRLVSEPPFFVLGFIIFQKVGLKNGGWLPGYMAVHGIFTQI